MLMKNIMGKYGMVAFGVVVGAIAGFAYWHFIGCTSGTCAITSKPVNSTLYGAIMGGLLLSAVKRDKKKSV